MSDLALLRCHISPGAFSRERTFRFTMADGGEYCGYAPAGCFRARTTDGLPVREPLGDGVPAAGVTIEGFVEVWRVAHDDARTRVALPGNDLVDVWSEAIPFVLHGHTVIEPLARRARDAATAAAIEGWGTDEDDVRPNP